MEWGAVLVDADRVEGTAQAGEPGEGDGEGGLAGNGNVAGPTVTKRRCRHSRASAAASPELGASLKAANASSAISCGLRPLAGVS
jgi:hypothetical protein